MKSLLTLACLAVALALGSVASAAAVGGVPSLAASKRYGVPPVAGLGASTAVGDLNGDGRPDVVSVNENGTISVFMTKPGGTLGSRRDYLAASDPVGAAIADLNGDGHADVAVAEQSGFVSVFLNKGDGALGA